MDNNAGWIGVDLDGTLAIYEGWKGAHHVGAPIPLMMDRVKYWISQGITVKIFTARAGNPENIPAIKRFMKENGLPELEITDRKDFNMIDLWDDRCHQVIMNTGILVE